MVDNLLDGGGLRVGLARRVWVDRVARNAPELRMLLSNAEEAGRRQFRPRPRLVGGPNGTDARTICGRVDRVERARGRKGVLL